MRSTEAIKLRDVLGPGGSFEGPLFALIAARPGGARQLDRLARAHKGYLQVQDEAHAALREAVQPLAAAIEAAFGPMAYRVCTMMGSVARGRRWIRRWGRRRGRCARPARVKPGQGKALPVLPGELLAAAQRLASAFAELDRREQEIATEMGRLVPGCARHRAARVCLPPIREYGYGWRGIPYWLRMLTVAVGDWRAAVREFKTYTHPSRWPGKARTARDRRERANWREPRP